MLIVALCVLAVYWPSLSFGPLNWDDQNTIFQNPAFHPPSWRTAATYWQRPHMSLYVPVTYTIWTATAFVSWADGAISPVGFRLLSLALHVGTSLLVLRVLGRLIPSPRAALLGALVFALHPVQVESVCWISGGKDLLGGFFSVLTLLMVLRGLDRGRWTFFALAGLTFALALLSKPSAVVAPVWIAAVAWAFQPSRWRIALGIGAGLLLLSLPVALIGKAVQPALGTYVPPWYERPLVAGFSAAFYLFKIVVPARLAVVYEWDVETVLRSPIVKFAWTLPLLVIALTAWALHRRALMVVSACVVFIAAIFPMLGLLPFEYQEQSTVADHYLYPAMLGVAVMIAWLAQRRSVANVCIVILVALGARSFVQVWTWRDTPTLFNHVLAADPGNVSANRTLGYLAARQGNIAAAMAMYERALQTHPTDPTTRINRGNLLLKLGDVRAAIVDYEIADRSRSPQPSLHNNYGIALARMGDMPGALRQFERAAAADPSSADPLANAAAIHAQFGNSTEARRMFQAALAINPQHRQAQAGLKKLDDAIR